MRKRGGRLVVTARDHTLLMEIPTRQLTAVAVFGGVQITTQAMTELLDGGVAVALFTKNGRLKGHLVPAESKNVSLRMRQYEAHLSESKSLAIGRAIVHAKVRNQLETIQMQRSNYPESIPLQKAEPRIREILDRLEGESDGSAAAAAAADDLDAVRGLEGAAAAAYFGVFGEMNRSSLPFEGRSKNPPRDPVNSLLSFGYMLVLGELRGLVEAIGLDPHIGFLHRLQYGRPSLALDLLEPYRANVDRLVLRCINTRIFQPGDFGVTLARPVQMADGGTLRDADDAHGTDTGAPIPALFPAAGDRNARGRVVLTPEALKRYLMEYEGMVRESGWRGSGGAFDRDLEGLCRALRSEEATMLSDLVELRFGGGGGDAVSDLV